jgi:hypothetical protein
MELREAPAGLLECPTTKPQARWRPACRVLSLGVVLPGDGLVAKGGGVEESLCEVTLDGDELVDHLALSRERLLEPVVGERHHCGAGGGAHWGGTKLTGQVGPHLQ